MILIGHFWGGVSVEDLEFRVRGGEYNGYGLGQLFLAAKTNIKKQVNRA